MRDLSDLSDLSDLVNLDDVTPQAEESKLVAQGKEADAAVALLNDEMDDLKKQVI